VIGALVLLVAVNEAMLPVPLAARPIAVLLLVQLYTVPVTAPLKVTADVDALLHTTSLLTAFTVGVGFTVYVKVVGVPVQVVASGTTIDAIAAPSPYAPPPAGLLE
jgi:hypothetical protein